MRPLRTKATPSSADLQCFFNRGSVAERDQLSPKSSTNRAPGAMRGWRPVLCATGKWSAVRHRNEREFAADHAARAGLRVTLLRGKGSPASGGTERAGRMLDGLEGDITISVPLTRPVPSTFAAENRSFLILWPFRCVPASSMKMETARNSHGLRGQYLDTKSPDQHGRARQH